MKFRLPLVAALALIAGACSQSNQPSGDSALASAASASAAHAISARNTTKAMLAPGYGNRFAAAPDHGALVVYPQAAVVRHDGAYTSYLSSVSEAHARDAIGGVLTVPLPTGEQLRFRYERHVEHANGDWTWIGGADGAKGEQAIITFGDKAAFGTIGQAGAQPWRLTVQNGASWLIRTDAAQLAMINNRATRPSSPDYLVPPRKFAGATHRAAASGALTATSSTSAAATSSTAANTVDLVIGYTPGFVSYYGGDSQAQTRLNNMVDITNQAYVNSGVDARVRLVKAMQVSYADNTSNDSALEALTGFKAPSTQTSPDAAFSALRAARDQYGADLVSLVRRFQDPENAGCGIAWLIGGGQVPIDTSDEFFGYSVVSDGRDAGTDGKTYYCREETLAHELGHNMGAQHDRATAQGDDGTLSSDEYGRYAYSFGYKTTSATGNFYTIMAYGDSGQTSYRIFSNPRTTFCGGRACGVTDQADNARTLAQTIPSIATFRATAVSAPSVSAGVRNDVSGDGNAELLWYHSSRSAFAYWNMDGARYLSYRTQAAPSGYSPLTTGDYDGDGRADVLWRDVQGNLQTWIASASGSLTARSVNTVYPAGWNLVGSGDVNGDDKAEIIWYHPTRQALAYWTMDGATYTGYRSFAATVGYSPVSVGDYDGDGRTDVLWRNSSGAMQMWLATATGFSARALDVAYPTGWTSLGSGDFDGDGKSDLLWYHPTRQALTYWVMNGPNYVRYYTQAMPAGYTALGVGDYNHDGRADVFLRHPTATLLFWQGTGAAFSQSASASYPSGWQPVAGLQ